METHLHISFQKNKIKKIGATITCWKLIVASIFECKSTHQKQINHNSTKFQWIN